MKGIKIKIDNFMFAIHYPHIPHSKHAFDYSKKKKKKHAFDYNFTKAIFHWGCFTVSYIEFSCPDFQRVATLPLQATQNVEYNNTYHEQNVIFFIKFIIKD